MSRDPLIDRTQAARLAFFEQERDLFRELVTHGQSPDALLIACSDSRIVGAGLMGTQPGEVFVVRTVGAVVPPYGTGQRSVGAALEFALDKLRVRHVVVCGHTDCGAIQALDTPLDQQRLPNLATWLDNLRPARTSVDARQAFDDPYLRHVAIVQQSVLLQLRNLATYPLVQTGLQQQTVQLHGWVYSLETGRLSYYDPDVGQFVVEDAD
ncbi:MAG: carbonic anhydrase [Caldilineales bacterium]